MRSREISESSVRHTLRLQSVIKQFQADLIHVTDVKLYPAVQYDGATLRLTRTSQGGVQVVAWTVRSGRLRRWAGDPVSTVGLLDAQWATTQQLQGTEVGTLPALKGVAQWQILFSRGGAWTNAQNSAGRSAVGGLAGQDPAPSGVRLLLTMDGSATPAGRITRDVLVAPLVNQN